MDDNRSSEIMNENPAGEEKPMSGIASFVLGSLKKISSGQLSITLPSGRSFNLIGSQKGPQAALNFRSWAALWRMKFGGDMGFADAYLAGEVTTPSLVQFFRFALANLQDGAGQFETPRPLDRIRHALKRNSLKGSKRNIMAHYDLGNEFYSKWLDPSMTYSSAIYSREGMSLEQAQHSKLSRVIELLETRNGDEILEIGCGWGGLAERLATQFKLKFKGLTLSMAQLSYAQHRLSGSAGVSFALQDYREVTGTFDRIVSIEMLEAVGAEYWQTYFNVLRSRLKTGGIAVLQAITIAEDRYENYRRRPDFIQKYIFPGGMLPTRSIIEDQCKKHNLTLEHVELFGQSYARTLGEWQNKFQQAWPDIAKMGFDQRFKRAWEYYLDYCRAGFEADTINVGLYKLVAR